MQNYTNRNVGDSSKKMSTQIRVGIILIAVSAVLILCVATGFLSFIRKFFLGAFGLSSYAMFAATIVIGAMLLRKKRYHFSKVFLISIIGIFFMVLNILQLAFTDVTLYSFADYVSNVYQTKITPGGVLAGMIAYGFASLFNVIGAYIVFGVLIGLFSVLVVDRFLKEKEYNELNMRTMSFPLVQNEPPSHLKTPVNKMATEMAPQQMEEPEEKEQLVTQPQPKLTLEAKLQKMREEREKEQAANPLNSLYSNREVSRGNDKMAEKIFGSAFINSVKQNSQSASSSSNTLYNFQQNNNQVNDYIDNGRPKSFVHEDNSFAKQSSPKFVFEDNSNVNNSRPMYNNQNNFNQNNYRQNNTSQNNAYTQNQNVANNDRQDISQDNDYRPASKPIPIKPQNMSPVNPYVNNKKDNDALALTDEDLDEIFGNKPNKNNNSFDGLNFDLNKKQNNVRERHEQMKIPQTEPTKNKMAQYTKPSPYVKPPTDLLTTQSVSLVGNEQDEVYATLAANLEETLDSFKIPAKVVSITHGPAVTRYEVQMPSGIPVKRITNFADDIAMNMRAKGHIRIETPIPGKNLVGVEVPNEQIATVGLRDIIESPEFTGSKAPLTFALGKDIVGSNKVCNLDSMPHLLVAGSTGSGKSVCLNTILISLLYRLGPDELKLVLVDPKRVEFSMYNGIPHLLTPTAINEPKQANNALSWAIREMDRRYSILQKFGVQKLEDYNNLEVVYKGQEPKLPRIVIVIDELADLMMLAKKDIEDKIKRLTQLARAAGIHLIVATQRPSVDVITGTIKSNIPSRIAFAVTNYVDSKTILDQGGAENLLGRGDMLYGPRDLPEPIRIQCPFISGKEITNIVNFVKTNNTAYFDEELAKEIVSDSSGGNGGNGGGSGDGENEGGEFDPLLPIALKDFIDAKGGSISAIQRRHSVGFARAARIVDQMERAGFLAPSDGSSKTRQVLIDEEKYNELFGND